MRKIHYLIEYVEEFGYVTACNLKYEDSDNVIFSSKWEEVTCKKCLNKKEKMTNQKEIERILKEAEKILGFMPTYVKTTPDGNIDVGRLLINLALKSGEEKTEYRDKVMIQLGKKLKTDEIKKKIEKLPIEYNHTLQSISYYLGKNKNIIWANELEEVRKILEEILKLMGER